MSKQNFGKSDCGNQWSFTKMIYCDKAFICQENLILFLYDCLFCHILLRQYKNSPAAVHTESFFSKVLDKIFISWRYKYKIRFQTQYKMKASLTTCVNHFVNKLSCQKHVWFEIQCKQCVIKFLCLNDYVPYRVLYYTKEHGNILNIVSKTWNFQKIT